MSLPIQLQTAVEHALNHINHHPQHEYHPEKRKELMQVVTKYGKQGRITRAWLAIKAAESVATVYDNYVLANAGKLRIFDADNYRSFCLDSIQLAINVLQGSETVEKASSVLIESHYYMTDYIATALPYRVANAAKTSSRAIAEVVICIESDTTQLETDIFWSRLHRIVDSDGTVLRGEKLTNLAWASFMLADTAAYALIVKAYDIDTKIIYPSAALEFWQWWLTEALPQAWELASQTGINHQDNST